MKFDISNDNNEDRLSPSLDFENLPEIYRGLQIYETESDRFCTFDEDYFLGEEYDLKESVKRRRIIREPKISPLSFFGFFCGALSVLLIAGGIVFFSSFSKSGGIYRSVRVPALVGLSESESLSILSQSKDSFEYTIEYKENPNIPEGTIISQIPSANTERKLYGINSKITVKLTVSKTTRQITLPNLKNQMAREASLELRNAGINVMLDEVYSDTVEVGRIISASLPYGSKMKKNDSLILTVSKGKYIHFLPVPSLLGYPEANAEEILKRSGFTLGRVTYESSELPLGTIIAQSADSDTTLREGSKISITVSRGK